MSKTVAGSSTKTVIKIRLIDKIVSRVAKPSLQPNGWWKAKVEIAGEKVTVYRKSGRGIKTYEVPANMTTRQLAEARA
jgi:hypothetical protein